MSKYIFTSESVSEGHPDKICDRISDALLDAYLLKDPHAHTGLETLATTNRVILAGEVKSAAPLTQEMHEEIVRSCIREIGYEQEGFHWQNVIVQDYIHAQSSDIAQGVEADDEGSEGAGDQGIMFGYATRETDVLMPAPIYYAHAILKSLSDARHKGSLPGLRPDAKCQISVQYEDGVPYGTSAIVLSTQHHPDLSQEDVRDIVRPYIQNILPQGWMCDEKNFYVNPTGRFVIGGPDGDTGLTGRKIIIDTYGGAAPHGGGAFSGKDPTKVDRSAAYMARFLAKNIVAANLSDKCTLQLCYAIGVAKPIAIYINLHGAKNVNEEKLAKKLQEMVDLSPKGIRNYLKLNRPIYARTASYGHFGRAPTLDGGFSWEKLSLVDELKREFGCS